MQARIAAIGVAAAVGGAWSGGCGGGGTASVDAPPGPGTPDAPLPIDATRYDAPPPGLAHAWSRMPPAGLSPAEVPQLVAITFDDNFGLAHASAVGGVDDIVAWYRGKKNPAGQGKAADFDGAPIRTTLFHTSIYGVDSSKKVLGGKAGEDRAGRNRASWLAAKDDGHEVADHTVNHYNGGVVPLDPDPCCDARNWDAEAWRAEIESCRDSLSEVLGVETAKVVGFRTPFLGYNDSAFSALEGLGFLYDSTLPNCFAEDEDGRNCSWPYTLDSGSPDADVLARRFATPSATIPWTFPKVTAHKGLWELPPTTLIIPPDDVAARYGFTKGLRARVGSGPLPYPSVYEPSTGKIAGLDYTLLIDAHMTGAEMAAVLSYNLDLHLEGNRSPLVFVGHAHLYAFSTADDNPDTPSKAVRDERWKGLTAFLTYALTKPEVRLVSARDVIDWIVAREHLR